MDKIKEKVRTRSTQKSSKSIANNEKSVKVKKNRDKKIERSKKQKYSTLSSQTVIKDLKSCAVRPLTCVRNTFDNLSNLLKLSSITNQEMTNNGNNYCELGSDKTPIKLYSPFGFETPSPSIDRTHLRRSCRRQMFFSPTAKIKADVLYLNNGIRELNLISEGIENQFSPTGSTNFDSNGLNSNQSLI